jgi:hypothetical protein
MDAYAVARSRLAVRPEQLVAELRAAMSAVAPAPPGLEPRFIAQEMSRNCEHLLYHGFQKFAQIDFLGSVILPSSFILLLVNKHTFVGLATCQRVLRVLHPRYSRVSLSLRF